MGKVATFVVLLALALPGAAVARTVAPPGNSEADQYFQTLPGSSGPRTPDSTRTLGDALREGSLSSPAARGLERRGEAGRALAGAVAQTAPRRAAGGSGGGTPGTTPAPPGDAGLGAAFPLILVAAGAAAAGFALIRRRRPLPW